MECKRTGARIAFLLLGLLSIYVAGRIIHTQSSKPGFSDDEIARIRRLAAADDPGLAEALDRSRVYIPAGEFVMGSNDARTNERPQRPVYLDAYEIDRYEVIRGIVVYAEARGSSPTATRPRDRSRAGVLHAIPHTPRIAMCAQAFAARTRFWEGRRSRTGTVVHRPICGFNS